ncbi:NlpC/P60 family protein [Bacillus sp. H1a]|uniref:NlpC/P60 family protein n=1 Tax=Bacillus sp. H1a TaxID=1397276 RepID=UPI00046A1F42|nr:NlpC/P60 family protein [Bacillus sp. H1a]
MKKQIAAITLATTLGLSIQPILSSAEATQNTQAAQQSGWVQEENGKWFFYENGAKKTGWLALEGKWYYLDPNAGGAMKVGWAQVEGKWFYLNPNEGGAMKTGWEKVEGKWYYLDPTTDGSMKTGWVQIEGKWYYLNPNEGGAAKIGWEKVEEKWYYFDGNDGAAMKTGWVQVEGKWYYLNPNEGGAMKTGWEKVEGKWYYLDGNDGGAMKTGWFQENDKWYYLDGNAGGAMVTGQATIDGKTYVFAADGKWIESESSGIIDLASKQLGKSYVSGNSGPNSFDCSGLIYYVFKNNGYNIGRTSVAGYWGMVTKISSPQPGDLVFLQNTYKAGPSHMGIYLGNGEFIHAADERTGVTKGNVNSQYNREHFLGYGRFTK